MRLHLCPSGLPTIVAEVNSTLTKMETMVAAEAMSLKQDLLLQTDKIMGVMLTCATGFLTILGALVVYSNRLAYMWEPRSLVVALGLATGGVLSFTLSELLPAAQVELEYTINSLVYGADATEKGLYVEGYASLVLAGAFSLGVIIVWVMDTLCLYWTVPVKQPSMPRDPTMLTADRSDFGGSPGSVGVRSPRQVLMVAPHADEWATKKLLYKTGTARVIAFAVQNIPEGMVLCIAADQKRTLGVSFACALALLNVTQGMTLAGVLTQASGYRWRGVLWCVLAALALPLGGFMSWAVLLQIELDAAALGVLYSVAGGILVGMALTQILTLCFNHKTSMSDSSPVAMSVLGGVIFLASIRAMLVFIYA